MLPAIPTPEDATSALDRTRLKAAVHLEVLLETLTLRGLDPTASFKNILDAFEANYKTSGLAAKQQAQSAPSFRVAFSFNAAKPAEKPIEAEYATIEPMDDLDHTLDALGVPPDHITRLPVFTEDLEFDDE